MGKKYDLNGKVALITGATGGIGAASARALYQQGASLVLTDLSRQALDSLATEFDAQRVLDEIRDRMAPHGIGHVTFQLEPERLHQIARPE